MFEFLSYGFTATSLTSLAIDPLVAELKGNPKNVYKGGTAAPTRAGSPG